MAQLKFIDNQEPVNILEHDLLFWCGDLNYRLVATDFDEIMKLINQNLIVELRKLDQLKMEKDAGRVFPEFEEGKISFAPTYKYKVGQHEFETEKRRIPPWCDRILYRGEAQLQFYTSVASVCESDHKPVTALFKVDIKRTDGEKRQKVLEDIYAFLEQLKVEVNPKLKRSEKEIGGEEADLVFSDL